LLIYFLRQHLESIINLILWIADALALVFFGDGVS